MVVEVTERGVHTPMDPSTTLSFVALEYWARVAPDRTALIYTDEAWKVKRGKLDRSVEPSEWKELTYKEFYEKVLRFRAALHQAGVPTDYKKGGYRVVILHMPKTKVELMSMILALQAAGCVTMFSTPKAMGGLRPFVRALLSLKPDAILCSRLVRHIVRSIAATTNTPKRETKLQWLNAAFLAKSLLVCPPKELMDLPAKEVPLDSVVAQMFSGGTTGFPTPIKITHRMQCFQAASYAAKLKERLGEDMPWISAHVFANFVMLDLMLGGTAVLQPMGTSMPDETICAISLKNIIQHFGAQVSTAPPALWMRLSRDCPKGSLQCLKVAVVGGAETSAKFARAAGDLLSPENGETSGIGFFRIYGTTQVLPVAEASAASVIEDEEEYQVCSSGCGVCLGKGVKGLDFSIDTVSWEAMGGRTQLQLPHERGIVEVGELCVSGKPLSPSLELVEDSQSTSEPPTRLFRTGDVCYIDPDTEHIHFLGRMAQSVNCGHDLGVVPPVGVEMLGIENEIAERCAFVAATKKGKTIPVIVLQLGKNEKDMTVVRNDLKDVLEKSIWSDLLKAGVSVAVYPKLWPVDERHSSKQNRLLLGKWASKLPSGKLLVL